MVTFNYIVRRVLLVFVSYYNVIISTRNYKCLITFEIVLNKFQQYLSSNDVPRVR